jgi:curved DNA-binding protein CbpA
LVELADVDVDDAATDDLMHGRQCTGPIGPTGPGPALLGNRDIQAIRTAGRDADADVPMTSLYSILQVERTAEPEVIRAAHRALARKHHPDFGGDPRRMAAINLAWSILGNPDRRARYDAMPQQSVTDTKTASTDADGSVPASTAVAPTVTEVPTRRTMDQRSGGSVLDFGRYAGWTVGTLADHDPNYLRWLSRTPIGRRLTVEIEGALGRREAEAASLRPDRAPGGRRTGMFGGLGSLRTAAR